MEAHQQHHRRNQRLNPNYEQLLANDNVIHAMGGTFLIRKSKLLDIVLRLPPLFLMDQVWNKKGKLYKNHFLEHDVSDPVIWYGPKLLR